MADQRGRGRPEEQLGRPDQARGQRAGGVRDQPAGHRHAPWTTTHDHNKGTGADYRTYLGKIEAEIGVKATRAACPATAPRGRSRCPRARTAGDPPPVAQPTRPGRSVTGADRDGDGLTDAFEQQIGTNTRATDSDADGFTDAYEALVSRTDPLGAGIQVRDADADGLADVAERLLGSRTTDTDSDNDKVTDAVEVSLGLNPTRIDSDGDGLTDAVDAKAGSAFDIDPGTAVGAPAAGGSTPTGTGSPTRSSSSPAARPRWSTATGTGSPMRWRRRWAPTRG